MAIAHSFGKFVGTTAAYAWEGSKLGATQFAQGAKEGYALKSADLIAARQAALAGQPPVRVTRTKPVTIKA